MAFDIGILLLFFPIVFSLRSLGGGKVNFEIIVINKMGRLKQIA